LSAVALGALFGLVSLTLAPATAAAAAASVRLGSDQATVDGRPLSLGAATQRMGGEVWASLRPLAEALGAQVDWDAASRSATVTRGEAKIELAVGGRAIRVNGQEYYAGVPVHIVAGRLQVPVRALGEGLGLAVGWDASSRTVTLAPASGAAAAVGLTVYDHPQYGRILADGSGRILYAFLRDEVGVSNCYDRCAQNWPPLLGSRAAVSGGTTGVPGSTLRRDGHRQLTYGGLPLYYYAGDQAPGQANGQGVGGIWFVVPADAATVSPPTLHAARHSELGDYLVDTYGRSLYLFTRDEDGMSACYDRCAENWPPLRGMPSAAGGLSGAIGSTSRTDGSSQVTYHGRPLYYFARDIVAGDTNGQGLNGVWYLVSPTGEAVGLHTGTGAPATPQPAAPAPRPTPMPAQPSQPEPSPPAPEPQPRTHQVTIRDFTFGPRTLTIRVGDTVVWTNEDAAPHTVTSTASGGPLDSGRIDQGERFSYTFTAAGEYDYYCEFHPNMTATIIVQP
ncbi:MAG TPA: stalk domain-containing protein, partial [Bacillota bacterium]